MKKELLVILLILGLPTFFITTLGPGLTGKIVNDVGQLKVDRINLLAFPFSPIPFLKQPVYDVKKYLAAGADENFYYPYGLGSGNNFFYNEQQLVLALLKLMCLQQTGQPNGGLYASYQGLKVHLLGNRWYGYGINYMGNFPCDYVVQDAAHKTLQNVLELDFKLVDYTIQQSNCPEQAREKLTLAQQYLVVGEYEPTLDYLNSAWNQATACK